VTHVTAFVKNGLANALGSPPSPCKAVTSATRTTKGAGPRPGHTSPQNAPADLRLL